MKRFAICGVSGRMGHAIYKLMDQKGVALGAAFDAPSSPSYGKDAGEEILRKPTGVAIGAISADALADVDAVIDFSAPAATMALLDACVATKTPAVIATTGLDEAMEARLAEASQSIAIVRSTNMSIGVNILFKLTELASKAVNDDFDVEVFEAHHRHKKDSPSGTASTLIRTVKESREGLKDAPENYRPRGIIGERDQNEIGVQVLRGGGIIGEHTVFFVSENERIELTHRAGDRTIFANGAVLAASFLIDKEPGIYTMIDVLGL